MTAPTTERICTIDGCSKPWRTRRLCHNHYEQHRTRMRMYGRWGEHGSFVDAQPCRDHIHALAAAGISWKQLHKLSGVPLSSISRIIHGRGGRERGHEGPAKHVTRRTAQRILSVPVPTRWWEYAADGRVGDGTGTRRRIQALSAIGWSQTHCAQRLGWQVGNLNTITHGRCGNVTADTARKIAALYTELVATPGNCDRARRTAQRNGWVSPLAWDDIDDPDEQPNLGEPDSKQSLADRCDELERLVSFGLLPEQAASRVGWKTWGTVTTSYMRLGRRMPWCRNGHPLPNNAGNCVDCSATAPARALEKSS